MNPIRWYQRLSFRLAIALFAAATVAVLLAQPIYMFLPSYLGFPGAKELASDDMESVTARNLDRQKNIDEIASALLESMPSGPGARPHAEALRVLDSFVEILGDDYLILDERDIVVVASAKLGWKRGDRWPYPLVSHTRVPCDPGGPAAADAVYSPLGPTQAKRGTFVLLFRNVSFVDKFIEFRNRREWLGRIVSAFIILATALILGGVVSALVTRRLARLTWASAVPLESGANPTERFDDRGNDEIAVLARTLNASRERILELVETLEARDVTRREWVAQVSHDLRTPLAALMACLERGERLLESGETETLRREFENVLAVAKLDAQRVYTLAIDLFDIARLDANDSLRLEPVPPGELVRQTVTELSAMAEAGGKVVEVDIASTLPLLTADGHRLMRALENVLRNALQHASKNVLVRAHRDGDCVRFEVRDDGPGLPVENGAVLLGRRGGTRSGRDSAGLGLVVTRLVAAAHEGSFGGENLPNGGASVWFTVPLSPADTWPG